MKTLSTTVDMLERTNRIISDNTEHRLNGHPEHGSIWSLCFVCQHFAEQQLANTAPVRMPSVQPVRRDETDADQDQVW